MDFSPATLIQVLRHRIRGGGGSRPSMILMTQGGGVQNLGKPDDVILERSLMCDNVLAEIVALKVAR